jgi:UDP-N-acetylmuramate dehydrogenase
VKTKTAGADSVKTSASFIRDVRERIRGEIKEDEPMARHTSFRIGGPADAWAQPSTREDLFALIGMCIEKGVPHMIIGRGTNILVRDGGFRGVIINLEKACAKMDKSPPTLVAGSAVSLGALARAAAESGLAGLEFCSGIPGSVGGGLATNAGAWGKNLCDKLERAIVYDKEALASRTIAKSEIDLGYRKSNLAAFGVILEAVFALEADDAQAVKDRMKQYRIQRSESQPPGSGSAGCVFKNPPGGYAGALIDALGFKGFMHGDAMVSDVHANFIINTGSAGADDVLAIIDEIKRRALETSGIELEEEIEVVGEK